MPRPTFRAESAYAPPTHEYRLLPFRFTDLDDKRIVVNEVGEYHILDKDAFDLLVSHRLPTASKTYDDLKAKHFLIDSASPLPLTLLATKYRTKRAFLRGFTSLHIFVVTLRCDTSCRYCQVSRVSADKRKYDMSRETADRALGLAFRSPGRELKFEFQGGEPLLNFELVKYIVEEAERRNLLADKEIQFVVTTNLSLITDEILTFLREHSVFVSTSLDGPPHIHNANRHRPGNDAYETTIRGIELVRSVLGPDSVSALMTTTRLSLEHPEAVVDEYVARGFNHIFIRPISPYGFARRTQQHTGYGLEAFLTFYQRALKHIVELNRAGHYMVEVYGQILLTKILTPFATGYVDLQSPSGAGISVAVYNYDGDVYATDEGRMLAEMGDRTFKLGNVHRDTYGEMFGGPLIRTLAAASCVESLPGCADCPFQLYCGADPVENHATQGDIFGHRPTSNFCGRNMAIIKHLLRLYHSDDPFIRRLFASWVLNTSPTDLVPQLPV